MRIVRCLCLLCPKKESLVLVLSCCYYVLIVSILGSFVLSGAEKTSHVEANIAGVASELFHHFLVSHSRDGIIRDKFVLPRFLGKGKSGICPPNKQIS